MNLEWIRKNLLVIVFVIAIFGTVGLYFYAATAPTTTKECTVQELLSDPESHWGEEVVVTGDIMELETTEYDFTFRLKDDAHSVHCQAAFKPTLEHDGMHVTLTGYFTYDSQRGLWYIDVGNIE